MRSRGSIFALAVIGLLLVVDPVAVAHAGSSPSAPLSSGAASSTTSPDAITTPVHGYAPPKHTTPTHSTFRVRRPVRSLSSQHIPHPPTNRVPSAPVQASPPAQPPSMCAAVVATIAWPRQWKTVCAPARPGLLGLTNPSGTTTFFVRSGESLSTMHVVALHEAGHVWDFARLDKPKIASWCTQRGCDASHFFAGGTGGLGWGQPGGAEDWAAVWDACHGGDYHRSYLGLAAPTAADCARQNALVGYR